MHGAWVGFQHPYNSTEKTFNVITTFPIGTLKSQAACWSLPFSYVGLMASSASANTPLLPVTRDSTSTPKSWGFFKVTCIGSKAARLVLLWNFAVILAYKMLYNIDMFMQVDHTSLVLMLCSPLLLYSHQ